MMSSNWESERQFNEWRAVRAPRIARGLERLITPLHRFFDWLYHSHYNPLYRSGALATWLLFLVIVSGVYLLLFYQVGSPYESVMRLQSQAWAGRWIRAFHRYASDASVIAVIFHVIQLLVQGRSWGPRLLAWLSGIILTGAIFFSAWSGYVMVWDTHGQLLATAGAQLLQVLPFLHDAIARAFDGSSPVASSFFFMNLFLHVAIPLGMTILLWVHTAKLARNSWVPERWTRRLSTIAFIALAVLWPAPLPREADLLKLIGVVPADLFFAGWVPLLRYGILPLIGAGIFANLFLFSIPWWWRPRKAPVTSQVKADLCDGCQQCVRDCPFQAIRMQSRSGQKLGLAVVDAEACVSCGVCGASCHSSAIGLPNLTGIEQVQYVDQHFANTSSAEQSIAFLYCASNAGAQKLAEEIEASNKQVHGLPLFCCGTLHMDVLEALLKKCRGAFIWGCPERCCHSRDGARLMKERIMRLRAPSLPRGIPAQKVCYWGGSCDEGHELRAELEEFSSSLNGGVSEQKLPPAYIIRSAISSLLILSAIAAMSSWPLGQDGENGALRIAFRLPGQAPKSCRAPTAQELASVPKHMQMKEICESRFLEYRLIARINGETKIDSVAKHSGARGDRPISIHEEVQLAPGLYKLEVELVPLNEEFKAAETLSLSSELNIERGAISLVTQRDNARLVLTP
ncbi:MAG: cytochrome b N-terminal domain-containing protein [Oligoflexia bacterium]|nr:cytochrome b N-terminal domain-containing protein [Oligoflexia bacterium]